MLMNKFSFFTPFFMNMDKKNFCLRFIKLTHKAFRMRSRLDIEWMAHIFISVVEA